MGGSRQGVQLQPQEIRQTTGRAGEKEERRN